MAVRTSRAVVAVVWLALTSAAGGPVLGASTEFRFGGYVKLDVLATEFEDGQVPIDSTLRDFHVPAFIPIGGDDSRTLDFHAKESRFSFGTETDFEDGGPDLRSYLELDFQLSDLGDERVSNSYQPRLRHAYLEYGKWRFGQDWSTFMVVVLPDDLDFIGTADGMIFERQPQIRYSREHWQFAIENPDTTVTPFGGGALIDSGTNTLPDLVARYNRSGPWGRLSAAALARQLAYVDNSQGIDETDFGWGLNLGGVLKVGKRDDIRLQIAHGKGLGRYAAINFATGVVVDGEGGLEPIGTTSGFVAYRHHWNTRWRSTFNVSGIRVDNDEALTGSAVNKAAWQGSANVIFSPIPPLSFGLEFMRALRELEGGEQGAFNRLQFSARYDFSFSTKTGG